MPGSRLSNDPETGVGLRTVEPEDADVLQQGNVRPALRHPLGSRVRAAHEVSDRIEDGEYTDGYLVCLDDGADPPPAPETVTPVGSVSVADADWRRPELTYWLVPEHHGEGYGETAVTLLLDHLFRTVDHPAVGAAAYEFNDASRALLESLGFEQEGRTRRDRFVDGEYVDTIHYGLLREDWWADRPRSWRSAQDDV